MRIITDGIPQACLYLLLHSPDLNKQKAGVKISAALIFTLMKGDGGGGEEAEMWGNDPVWCECECGMLHAGVFEKKQKCCHCSLTCWFDPLINKVNSWCCSSVYDSQLMEAIKELELPPPWLWTQSQLSTPPSWIQWDLHLQRIISSSVSIVN